MKSHSLIEKRKRDRCPSRKKEMGDRTSRVKKRGVLRPKEMVILQRITRRWGGGVSRVLGPEREDALLQDFRHGEKDN